MESPPTLKNDGSLTARAYLLFLISLNVSWFLGSNSAWRTTAWVNALHPIKPLLHGRLLATTGQLMPESSGSLLMLSSSDVDVETLWKNLGDKTKIEMVYVPTAGMWLDPDSTSKKSIGERRSRQRASMRKRMKSLVATIEEGRPGAEIETVFLDVSDPTITRVDDLRLVTSTTDVLVVDGGNTWYLWYHMKRVGLDLLIQQSRQLVYVGISAGAIVAGKDISTALWKGWDKPVDELNLDVKENLIGMNLALDRSFFPHFSTEWQSMVSARSLELDHTCVLLRDKIVEPIPPPNNGSSLELDNELKSHESKNNLSVSPALRSWIMAR